MAYRIQEIRCKAVIGSLVLGANPSQSDCQWRRGSHFPKIAISSANLQQGVKETAVAQSLGMPLNWVAIVSSVMSFNGILPLRSERYMSIVSSRLRLPAICCCRSARVVKHLVTLVIRYTLFPVISMVPGLLASFSLEVWWFSHDVVSEVVISIEYEEVSNFESEISFSSSFFYELKILL